MSLSQLHYTQQKHYMPNHTYYKWKKHFSEMKGDVGMSCHLMKKKGNKKSLYCLVWCNRAHAHNITGAGGKSLPPVAAPPTCTTHSACSTSLEQQYGVVQCRSVCSSTVYSRSVECKNNYRFMRVHTSVEYKDLSWKIQGLNLLLSEDSGFEKEEEEEEEEEKEDDDDKNREISRKRKLTRRTGSR